MMSDKEFWEMCDTFSEGTSYEQYFEDVVRCLVLSFWHYSPEHARERAKSKEKFIREEYSSKGSACDAALEVGFCGG